MIYDPSEVSSSAQAQNVGHRIVGSFNWTDGRRAGWEREERNSRNESYQPAGFVLLYMLVVVTMAGSRTREPAGLKKRVDRVDLSGK